MAKAVSASYDKLVLEVETDTPGTYVKLCGMMSVSIKRVANIDTDEVPDCADETLPMYIEKSVRSLDVKVSATGIWAQSSHQIMVDWWRSGTSKNIRIVNSAVSVGDTEIEAGPALLASLDDSRDDKGKKVKRAIEIEFVGVPAVTDKA